MYEVWKITQGVMNLIDSRRDPNEARMSAIEHSNLHDAVYVVIRHGFGAALYAVWRGIVGDPVEIMRRMSAEEVPPVQPRAMLPEDKPDGSTGSARTSKPRARRKKPDETKARTHSRDDREYKIFPAAVISVDEALGIVEAVVNTYGIIDDGEDRVWYGSAAKTLAENFGRIRVLNSHNNRNVLDVVGKPLVMRELTRDELPTEIQMRWPTATGGLYTKTQYLIDTPEGLGVFKRIVAGAVDEYSIGFDSIVTDMERVTDENGKQRTIRNIREIRLWEYSPVVWGMNPATTSISAKGADTPTEAKPYAVFPMNDEYCVFKVDENGERMGEPLGCHATESEANDQVAALYAAEADKARKEYTPQGAIRRLGDVLLANMIQGGTSVLTLELGAGTISADEFALLSSLHNQHLNEFRAMMPDDVALREMPEPMFWFGAAGPDDTKIGRVLSERNYNAIKQAHELLTTVMQSAGLTEGDAGEEASKSQAHSNDDATDGPPASTNAPTSTTEAGPQDDETPATKRDQLLTDLRQRLAHLEAI